MCDTSDASTKGHTFGATTESTASYGDAAPGTAEAVSPPTRAVENCDSLSSNQRSSSGTEQCRSSGGGLALDSAHIRLQASTANTAPIITTPKATKYLPPHIREQGTPNVLTSSSHLPAVTADISSRSDTNVDDAVKNFEVHTSTHVDTAPTPAAAEGVPIAETQLTQTSDPSLGSTAIPISPSAMTASIPQYRQPGGTGFKRAKKLKQTQTNQHVNNSQGSSGANNTHPQNRSNAWIQTESSTFQCSMGDTQNAPTSSSSNYYDQRPSAYSPNRSNAGPWADQTLMYVIQGHFLDMLPLYVDACITLGEAERIARYEMFAFIQAIVKHTFGNVADISIYGSVETDLALPSSDIDLLVSDYRTTPQQAIQTLSTALLDMKVETLSMLMSEASQHNEEDGREESERGSMKNPHLSPTPPLDGAAPGKEASATGDVVSEKEQYFSPEDLETAEEEYRNQIVKDYTFSKHYTYNPFGGSISAPTELSKGTNTDIVPPPLLPKTASIECFWEGDDDARRDTPQTSEGVAKELSSKSKEFIPPEAGAKSDLVDDLSGHANEEKASTPEPTAPRASYPVQASPAAAQRQVPPYYTFVPTLEGQLFCVQTITSARVPVIKITDKRTMQRADITFGGGEHSRSLHMTQRFLESFPPARPLIIFLKHCVSLLGIGDSAPGGVTSFAIFLMVRHVYNAVVLNPLPKLPVTSTAAGGSPSDGLSVPRQVPDEADAFVEVFQHAVKGKKDGKLDSASFSNLCSTVRSFVGSSEDGAAVPGSIDATADAHTNAAGAVPPGQMEPGPQGMPSASSNRDQMTLSHFFKDFCYYFGCVFNFEAHGIHFSSDGGSEVVSKPFQCARRGQLFHLTSPFDPDYDLTARMSCMREFQWMCEFFSSVIINQWSFYNFLLWITPQTAQHCIFAMRNKVADLQLGHIHRFNSHGQRRSPNRGNANSEDSKSQKSTSSAFYTLPSSSGFQSAQSTGAGVPLHQDPYSFYGPTMPFQTQQADCPPVEAAGYTPNARVPAPQTNNWQAEGSENMTHHDTAYVNQPEGNHSDVVSGSQPADGQTELDVACDSSSQQS